MKMSSMEMVHPVDRYSDEELDQMSWRELSGLSLYNHDTLWYRVVKCNMTRREAVKSKPIKHRSELSRTAAKHNLPYGTLATRAKRHPDVPLDVLAQQPVLQGADRWKPALAVRQQKRKS